MEKIKIFVTGHKGFIGSNLLKLLEGDAGVKLITYDGNILDKKIIENFIKKNMPDVIIHLVGIFSGNFKKLMKINVQATQIISSLAQKYSVKKIILASSGAVYGTYKNKSYKENDILLPNTLYGLSKKMSEEILFFYSRISKFSYIILRFPNIYCEEQGKGVIAKFTKGIKNKKEIIINGNGFQKRNFLHISDACEAIKKAIHYDGSNTFNISSSVNLSINQLALLFKKKYKFEIKYSKTTNQLNNLNLSYKKAIKKMNYKPTVESITL